MKKIFLCSLRWLLLTLLVCIQSSALATVSNTPLSLTVGLNPWIGNALFYIANEKGFFKEEHLNMNLVKYNEGAVAKQLLASGKIDMVPTTAETPLVLADAGIAVKVIGILNTSKGADGIVAVSGIKKVSDLKGKKVAFEQASSSELMLSHFLQENGLTLKDIDPVNLSASDSGAAFVAGRVDAAVTWEPWLSRATARPGGHVLIDSKAMILFPDLYIFNAAVVEKNPEAVKAMLRALFKAVQFTETHHQDSVTIIAKNFGLSNAVTEKQLNTLKWLNLQENLYYFSLKSTPNVTSMLQEASDLWVKLGILKHPINASRLVDDKLLLNLYSKKP